jgi:hypothetical protein
VSVDALVLSRVRSRVGLGLVYTVGVDAPRSYVDFTRKRWDWVQGFVAAGAATRFDLDTAAVIAVAGLQADLAVNHSESLALRRHYRLIGPSVVGGVRLDPQDRFLLPWIGLSAALQAGRDAVGPLSDAGAPIDRLMVQVSVGWSFELPTRP